MPWWGQLVLAPFLIWGALELFILWTGWDALFDRLGGRAIDDASTVGKRFGMLLPGLAIAGVALYSMVLRGKHVAERATAFCLLSIALAFYILLGAELFYVVDHFGNRMNTVFKFYYQAWVLLAIASAYGVYYVVSKPLPKFLEWAPAPLRRLGMSRLLPRFLGKPLTYGWWTLVAVLLVASIYYPVGAAISRTDLKSDRTLDGLAFLQRTESGEHAAILWLRDEAPWGRIVEAAGDHSYGEHGRISASTGLPTMLGWKGHERQWRGTGVNHLLDEREQQVATIYTSDDPETVRELLETHDIRYVYLGHRERREYTTPVLDGFSSFLRPVFQADDVVIYERLQPQEGA